MGQGAVYSIETNREQIPAIMTGNGFVHILTLFWIIGVILLDKNFAYIHVGPIYITEFVLFTMIAANIRRIAARDVFLMAVVGFYFAGGVLRGHDIFFSIRDLAWMYYLLFLRFFPRDFPKKYIRIVLYTAWIRILLIFCKPLLGSIVEFYTQKYTDGVVILFIAAYLSLASSTGRLNILSIVILSVASYLSDYKTLIAVIFLLPFILAMKHIFAKWHSPRRMGIFAAAILLGVYFGEAKWLLSSSVKMLNFTLEMMGINKTYQTGTADWRAEIWTKALLKLSSWYDLLFGEFPGHNFMNSKFLGIRAFQLGGGEHLGITRTAHNILVQITMKTGIIGLFIYGWYYFKTNTSFNPTLKIFRILALSLAMTADILEVPSRGPLLFCFFIILEISFESPSTEVKSSHESQRANVDISQIRKSS